MHNLYSSGYKINSAMTFLLSLPILFLPKALFGSTLLNFSPYLVSREPNRGTKISPILVSREPNKGTKAPAFHLCPSSIALSKCNHLSRATPFFKRHPSRPCSPCGLPLQPSPPCCQFHTPRSGSPFPSLLLFSPPPQDDNGYPKPEYPTGFTR